MKKSVTMMLLSLGVATLAVWFAGLRYEGGIDSALYHNMAGAIVAYARAPWILHPLSYVGIYPGSDSSGVPFLIAEISATTGMPITASILAYNAALVILLELAMFSLTWALTHRLDAALLASTLGPLACGFISAMLWTMDERSLNVAMTPVFLYLLASITLNRGPGRRWGSVVILAAVSVTMIASHLSFLLLLPLALLVPLVIELARRQPHFRRRTSGSAAYFLGAVSVPIAVIAVMGYSGLLDSLGLALSLEHSALFSGASPIDYLLNTVVFLSTRAGPIAASLAVIGFVRMGTKRYLTEDRLMIGAILLGGLVGLPVIVYSKDLIVPMLILPASLAIPLLMPRQRMTTIVAFAVAGILIIPGSAVFNAWNQNRTLGYSDSLYWTSPGITMEPTSANLWIGTSAGSTTCIYGNNWLADRYVSESPFEFLCGDGPVEDLMRIESGLSPSPPIQARFVGIGSGSPNTWFDSPELDQVAQDFARIPILSYAMGRAVLLKYHVGYIVVSMEKPYDTPLYEYQGTMPSLFFRQLWMSCYPLYRTSGFAVFAV